MRYSPLNKLIAIVAITVCSPLVPAAVCPVFAEEIVVTFRLNAPELAEDTPVFITGSVPGLGNWNPDRVPMKPTGKQSWTHALTITEKQPIEYKYTLGSWQREGADANGQPLENFVADVDRSMEKRDRILFWTNGGSRSIRGQITGRVKYHRQMQGEGIRPRDIIVWLPPDYDTSHARYPVLYMHDGQNIIDPETSAFGVDWEVDETCTNLITEKCVPPLIVVGIYNTPDREREYLPGVTGTAYMNFLIQSLKPFVDRNYRTKSSRADTYTAGSSAGGLCAFMLAWEHSEVYSAALCMSPSLRYENAEGKVLIDYVSAVKTTDRPRAPVFFYLDNGGIGLEKLLQPGIDAMLEVLNAKGFKAERDYRFIQFPDDRHFESAWAKRFPNALQILLSTDKNAASNRLPH